MNIVISNLKKNYISVQALNIPSLTIGNSDLVGLVGNNGAGKTTMMRLILDLIQASEGKVEIEGENVAENPVWKTFTGSYLDSSFLIEFYTPEEFFGFIAETYGISNDDLQSRLKEYESLMSGEILGKRKLIHDFSNGNKQKIGIIGAMIVNPQILILDEPFNYLDPSSQIVVAKLIRKMNEECGTTVLVSSHNLNSISDICNRIILLDKGDIKIDKPHTPGSKDQELESYFLAAVK